MYICCSLLLHILAAHGPSSGNAYYLERQLHCTYLLTELRHSWVCSLSRTSPTALYTYFYTDRYIVFIVVNMFYRIFLSYILDSYFSVTFYRGSLVYTLVLFTLVLLMFQKPSLLLFQRQTHRHLWFDFLENVAASMSDNIMGLYGLLQG
jgi:hypothetical protein